jgi:hypothetical protein
LYDNIYPKCKIADDILNQKEKYTHRHKWAAEYAAFAGLKSENLGLVTQDLLSYIRWGYM